MWVVGRVSACPWRGWPGTSDSCVFTFQMFASLVCACSSDPPPVLTSQPPLPVSWVLKSQVCAAARCHHMVSISLSALGTGLFWMLILTVGSSAASLWLDKEETFLACCVSNQHCHKSMQYKWWLKHGSHIVLASWHSFPLHSKRNLEDLQLLDNIFIYSLKILLGGSNTHL